MKPKLIQQGAEAKIYLVSKTDSDSQNKRDEVSPVKGGPGGESEPTRPDPLQSEHIDKQRVPKSYRHPALDKKIRTRRTRSESKILIKALAIGAQVPKVLHTDKFNIKIKYIKGDRLSETLNDYPEEKQFQVMKQLGKQVAILHEANIIHGDLTTSNTILSPSDSDSQNRRDGVSPVEGGPGVEPDQAKNPQNSLLHVGDLKSGEAAGSRQATKKSSKLASTKSPRVKEKVHIIDFGLGFISRKVEDKAVDLHLIKQALEAKHWQNHEDLFKEFTKGYVWPENEKVLERLITVEKRGRYKH